VFEHPSIEIEVTQMIIHKTDQPDIILNFFNADGLAGKDGAEVNLFATETDAAAIGDDNGFVVEGIIDIG
jgi:hypothetical protein